MTTGCLLQLEIIAGETPHVASVATGFSLTAVAVCLIDREAAGVALNATGQDGINMETLYQAGTEQMCGFATTCNSPPCMCPSDKHPLVGPATDGLM